MNIMIFNMQLRGLLFYFTNCSYSILFAHLLAVTLADLIKESYAIFQSPHIICIGTLSLIYFGTTSPALATLNLITLNCIGSVDHKVREWTKVSL